MAFNNALASGAFPLGASRRLMAWIILAAASATGLSIGYLPLPAAATVSILTVWFAWREFQRHALRARATSLIALRCDAAGLAYQIKQGPWIKGQPLTGGLVHPWLTVVRLRDEIMPRTIRTLVLFPDALAPADFRRLRVHLAWRYTEGQRSSAEVTR